MLVILSQFAEVSAAGVCFLLGITALELVTDFKFYFCLFLTRLCLRA